MCLCVCLYIIYVHVPEGPEHGAGSPEPSYKQL